MFDRKFLQHQEMGRWKSDAFENKELANKIFYDVKKYLKTYPHPLCSWRSVPNQKLSTIEINEHGLRSPSIENIETANNCMLLGGSVAWGFGASSNKNIPSYLIEKNLRELLKKNLNVINFAQNSFNSHDEIKSFVSYVDEIKPKIIITLTGINDIFHIRQNYNKVSTPQKKNLDFFLWGTKYGIIEKQNVFKKILKFFLRFARKIYEPNEKYFQFYKFKKEVLPVRLFDHKIDIINSYCEAKNIKVVHILQPLLIYKKDKSQYEKNYFNQWKSQFSDYHYNIENIYEYYESLKKKYFTKQKEGENCLYIDSTSYFDDTNKTIFFDLCHFSDIGNKILSDKASTKINEYFKNKTLFL